MKKHILISFICLALCLIYGCEKENGNDFFFEDEYLSISERYERLCPDCLVPDDVIVYPEPWTLEVSESFSIPLETLECTGTCGLVETFFNQPWLALGPWCSHCSDININGIEFFNSAISQNDVIQELIKRENVVEVLLNKYLNLIDNFKETTSKPGNTQYLEMLLASDAIRPLLTKQQAEELVIISLKMIENRKKSFESLAITTSTEHILVSILFYFDYEPFINDEHFNSGSLETWLYGYKICSEEESFIEQYAIDCLKNK